MDLEESVLAKISIVLDPVEEAGDAGMDTVVWRFGAAIAERYDSDDCHFGSQRACKMFNVITVYIIVLSSFYWISKLRQ